MERVFTPNAPQPAGHFSQAVVFKDLIFISGQLPIDPRSGDKRLGSIEEQAEQSFQNMAEVLLASGSDLGHVLKTTIFLTDMGLGERVDQAYALFFGMHRPARSLVSCPELPFGFKIEIEAIAGRTEAEQG